MRGLILCVVAVVATGGALFLLRGGNSLAAETSVEPLVAPERAAAIAMTCANCHGTSGRLETEIPALAGKPEMVLRAQLIAFKQDQFPGATVMPRLVKGYSDDELAAVARYFASLSPNKDPQPTERP